jgi:hypothetical protein
MARAIQDIHEKSRRKGASVERNTLTEITSAKPGQDDMLTIRVSLSGGDKLIAEFKISATDAVALFLDKAVFNPSKQVDRAPNKKLATSLSEAKHITPRFTTAKELFDGLEKAARG